jgi:hypothetical protein
MFGFHLDYFISCVIAVSGVLILSSAHRTSRFQTPIRFLGLLLMLLGGVLFFSTDDRVLNDYEGGLDANEQAILFGLSALTSLIIYKVILFFKKLFFRELWKRF